MCVADLQTQASPYQNPFASLTEIGNPRVAIPGMTRLALYILEPSVAAIPCVTAQTEKALFVRAPSPRS